MESSKTNEESDNNFDDRILYHKASQDIESSSVIEVEGGRRYSNDTYDGRVSASESSQKISPCVSQRSGVHFNQYNDGSVSDKSDQQQQQQQHVYVHGLGHVQEEGQGDGVSPSPSLIPIPSHSTTQIPPASSSFDDRTPSDHSHSNSPNHSPNHSPSHGYTHSDGPISLRTLPSRPPITIRNSSSNFDRDKKLFMSKHSKSVTDFFRKSKSTDPEKLIQIKRGDTSSKIRGIKLPTRSSFFSDVRQYVSTSTDKNEMKHERYSRRNRSGSMDGFEEKAEDVLGVLNSRDFIGYFEMQYSSKHTVSVTAIEACWYYTFDHANVLSLLESNPRVAFELQRALGLAIDEMDAKLLLHEKHQKRTEFLAQIRKKFLLVKMEKSRKYEVFNAFGKRYRYSKLKLDENGNNLDVSRRSSSDEIPLESWHSGSFNGNRNLNQLESQQKKKEKFFRYQGMLSVNHEVNDALKTDENNALKDTSSSSFNDDNKESKSSHTHTHTKHTQPHTHSPHHLHRNNTSENDKDHLTNITRSSKAYNNDFLTNPKDKDKEKERDSDARRDSIGSIGFTGTRARAKGIISASTDSADERYAYNMKWKLAELDRLEALCTFEEMGEECNRHRSGNGNGQGKGQGNGTSSGRGQGNDQSNKDETGSELGVEREKEGERGTETRLGTGTRRNSVRNEYKRKYTLGLNQDDVNVRPLRRTFRERLRSFRNRRNIPSQDRRQNDVSQDITPQPSPLLNPSPSLVPTPPLTLRQKFVNRVSLNRLSSDDISPRNSTSNSEMNSNKKLAIFSPNGIAVMEKKSSPLQYEIEAFSKHHRSSTDIFLTKGKTRKLDQNFEIGNKKIRRSLSDL